MSYVFKGLPSDIISTNTDGVSTIKVDIGASHKSKPTILNGDVTNLKLLQPANGNRLCLKAITIISEGNAGAIKVYRSNNSVPILVAYLSAQNRTSTSGAFNMVMIPNEYVYVTTTGVGTRESFIGISYLEIK